MFKGCIFKKGFLERLAIKYLKRKSSNLEEHYKVTSYHNPKPDFYLKVGVFEIEIIPKYGHSRLEKATEKEICECIEEEKEIERCSEERENRTRHNY